LKFITANRTAPAHQQRLRPPTPTPPAHQQRLEAADADAD
jgi:hypothetical protein